MTSEKNRPSNLTFNPKKRKGNDTAMSIFDTDFTNESQHSSMLSPFRHNKETDLEPVIEQKSFEPVLGAIPTLDLKTNKK